MPPAPAGLVGQVCGMAPAGPRGARPSGEPGAAGVGSSPTESCGKPSPSAGAHGLFLPTARERETAEGRKSSALFVNEVQERTIPHIISCWAVSVFPRQAMALQVTKAHGVPSGQEPAGGDGSPRAPSDAGGLVGNARGFT